MKKWFLKRLLKKIDSCCAYLSGDYGFAEEVYKIRLVLYEIRESIRKGESV